MSVEFSSFLFLFLKPETITSGERKKYLKYLLNGKQVLKFHSMEAVGAGFVFSSACRYVAQIGLPVSR